MSVSVSSAMENFFDFGVRAAEELHAVDELSYENGVFSTVVEDWEGFSPVEGQVFLDSDGGDFWTLIDGKWVMFDGVTGKVTETDDTWESLNINYEPIFALTAQIDD